MDILTCDKCFFSCDIFYVSLILHALVASLVLLNLWDIYALMTIVRGHYVFPCQSVRPSVRCALKSLCNQLLS